MKRTFIALCIAFTATTAFAGNGDTDKKILSGNAPAMVDGNYNADSTWKYGGIFGLNIGQVAIGDYWAAGGLSNYSLNTLFSVYANRKKGKFSWDNNLDLAYGVIKQGNRDDLGDIPWIKSDDKIELNSKAGYQLNKAWYLTGLLNFRTQMAPGYADPYNTNLGKVSNFMAPGYLILAAGMDYKPSDDFTMFISPATAKFTFVNDQGLADAGAFGVDAAVYDEVTGNLITAGATSRFEFGGYLKMMYKKDNLSSEENSFLNGISFMTKVDLFSNYLNNPQNIDVNWETLIGMKVNKYITATITTQLIYDHDIEFPITDQNGVVTHTGPRTQFKEALGIGFSYKF